MNSFAPFKNYDYILNDKSILLSEKIFALIELWNKISQFDFDELNLSQTIDLIDWALLHTMNIALTAEWVYYMDLFESKLVDSIEKAGEVVNEVSKGFEKSFQKILYVINNTWNIPVLDVIMKNENVAISKEMVNFFDTEQAHLISVRLIKLCESQCQDLALNLSSTFLKYLQFMKDNGRAVKITPDQISFVFDTRVALLYKWGRMKAIEEAVKGLSVRECQMCIKRFLNKKPNLLKIWKHAKKIAGIIVRILLEKLVINAEQIELLPEMLDIYLSVSMSTNEMNDFYKEIRKLCNFADAATLQVMCDFFKKIANRELYVFTVEIFIKALTADMNELEVQKVDESFDKDEKIREQRIITSRLASNLSSLAEYMKDKVKIAREIALTAFSVEPTVERLYILERLAKKSGLPVLDNASKWQCNHGPISSDCLECREYMSKFQRDIPMKANLALYEAIKTLDLPEIICDDLIICISNPRYQILSWYLPWMELYKMCVMYLKDPLGTRNYITELHYLNIDYSKFDNNQKEPLNPFAGIEKGFEKYLNTDYNGEESGDDSTYDNCAIEGEEYDPNSLESLKKILSMENVNKDKMEVVNEELGENWVRENKKTKRGLDKLKDKLCFFNKESSSKKPKKETNVGKKKNTIFGKKKSKCTK